MQSMNFLLVAGVCGLLGNPERLKILWFLASRGQPAPVHVIADELAIKQPNVSKHLDALVRAKLAREASSVRTNGRGQAVIGGAGYQANEQARHFLEMADKFVSSELAAISP